MNVKNEPSRISPFIAHKICTAIFGMSALLSLCSSWFVLSLIFLLVTVAWGRRLLWMFYIVRPLLMLAAVVIPLMFLNPFNLADLEKAGWMQNYNASFILISLVGLFEVALISTLWLIGLAKPALETRLI